MFKVQLYVPRFNYTKSQYWHEKGAFLRRKKTCACEEIDTMK